MSLEAIELRSVFTEGFESAVVKFSPFVVILSLYHLFALVIKGMYIG